MRFSEFRKVVCGKGLILILSAPLFVSAAAAPETPIQHAAALGTIKGVVRSDSGPIADATVAIFRVGTTRLLKQVQSAADGSFIAKVLPGSYTILAVAQGYNPETLAQVDVTGSAALTFGFKLERAGSGNTLPEKRLDRNNPKWVIRSAQTSRSIYQNTDTETPVVEETPRPEKTSPVSTPAADFDRRVHGVVESYYAATRSGNYSGVNFATLIPLNDDADLVLAGQAGTGNAPLRFESQIKFRPDEAHAVRLSGAVGHLGSIAFDDGPKTLGQLSFQATDEWSVRPGVILVLGVDYAKFFGAGNDFSISPRIGFQMDLDPKTRFRAAFTPHTESRTWSQAIDLEDAQIMFREPVAIDDFVIENDAPKMNRSNRLEFGIERVLDNSSSLEANFFLDTTFARGIGFSSMLFDSLGEEFTDFVGNQRGASQGMRVVYSRRISGRLSASAGYSFGRGQSLSGEALSNPAALFENNFFQSIFGQFEADLKTGTNVKTIFRLSPAATVFAIDPFQGRLAIYDPGLSVLVTQNLPTLGLPFHAQAIVDARNLFDFQYGITGETDSFLVTSQRRMVRGGILVRF